MRPARLHPALAGPAAAWGLRRGPRLVAAVRLRDLGHGSVDLGRLMVAPDLQGQGLGSRLLLRSEALVPAGTREIHLFTGERSEANLRLYRRHGYVETHRTPAGGHDLDTWKPLADGQIRFLGTSLTAGGSK